MRRALGIVALGFGVLMVGFVAIPWLLYRDIQWRRWQRWMGHYEEPMDPGAEGDELAQQAEAGARAA